MAVLQGGLVCNSTSLAASFNSDWVDIAGAVCVGVELYTASNTHVGNIAIQESISGDYWGNIQLSDDTLSNSQLIPLAASTATTKVYNLDGLGGKFLRISYTAGSGTGTLTAHVVRKNK